MSKGRRSQGPSHRAPERASESERDVEAGVGNAAQLEDLDGRLIPMDAAGDAAEPIVEHARLALEMRYEGETPMARLMELVQASDLPEDSARWLSHRLATTQANIERVDKAVVAAFGGTVAEARQSAERALDAVEDALVRGQATDVGWRARGRDIEVTPATTVRSAVDNLIGALADADGPAVVQLIRAVHLSLFFDEDEEDEDLTDLFS